MLSMVPDRKMLTIIFLISDNITGIVVGSVIGGIALILIVTTLILKHRGKRYGQLYAHKIHLCLYKYSNTECLCVP